MKSFNLEKALAGEPVVTRKGEKAFILSNLNNLEDKGFNPYYPLVGIIKNRLDVFCWTLEGRISLQNDEALGDIVGMWEEPRPRVQLDLPCPLKEPQNNMWFIDTNLGVRKSILDKSEHCRERFDNGLYFASEEDAQAWLDAMRKNRR